MNASWASRGSIAKEAKTKKDWKKKKIRLKGERKEKNEDLNYKLYQTMPGWTKQY